MKRILASLALFLLLPSLASAELDCIVPTREEGYDASRPGAEAVRRAARAIETIVKRNAVFMAGNEPVRVRTSISYYGNDSLAASVITTAYNKKAWVAEGCQISKFSDRGGGLSDGQIAVYINDAGAMLGGKLGDSELTASFGPREVGELAGYPLYQRGEDVANTMVLIGSSKDLPWVPVTIAEALDWREREIEQREASWQQQSGNAGKAETQLRAVYENMKKMDPAGAEKMRVKMERDLEKVRADEARAYAQSNNAIASTRAEFDEYRASFSAAQLREPATISGQTYRKVVPRVDDPKGRALVRINPADAQRDPSRIRLLVIPQYSVATDEDHQWQVASRNALDYAALAALLGAM
jgi:hypothetical protein